MLGPISKAIQILESKRIELKGKANSMKEAYEIDAEYDEMINRIKENDKAGRTLAEFKRTNEIELTDEQELAVGAVRDYFNRPEKDVNVNTVSGIINLLIKRKFEADVDGYYPYDYRVIDREVHHFLSTPYVMWRHGIDTAIMLTSIQNEASDLLRHEMILMQEKENRKRKRYAKNKS